MTLPKWLYYTGTRINASLKLSIEQITWKSGIGMAYVVDKGRHKSGREQWTKLIIGDLKQAIEENLKFQGTPTNGKLFPLSCQAVRKTFREAFKMANINLSQPTHIWRHTSAQDLLESNGWNYELAASILGWKDTRTLRLFYGAIGESVKENALRKAMGEPIQEKITEFRF